MKQITVGGKQVEVSDEQYEALLNDVDAREVKSYQDLVGESYFFRTVTYHLIGEVKQVVGRFVHLKKASIVFDSGNFSTAIKAGTLTEVEYVGEAFVNLDSVTDFFPWKHSLSSK